MQATQLDLGWIRLRSCFNDCDKPGLKLRVAPETATWLLPPQTPRPEGNLPPSPARSAGPRVLPRARDTLQPPRWAAARSLSLCM